MEHHVPSSDGVDVHYEVDGGGPIALVFVHGWLGNLAWWSAQRAHLAGRYTVVAIDLPGHGRSSRARTRWSAEQYADDIAAVAERVAADGIVLVGHSMSGAYVLEAAPRIARTRAVVVVDTLRDLDALMGIEQAEQQLFAQYRADFADALERVLAPRLFAPATPADVRARVLGAFAANDPELAIRIIEPLYRMDVRAAARRLAVPVRAINGDFTPTHVEHNRRYLRDYDVATIAETGHYPMLERPAEFNRVLDEVLAALAL
jgi:pimeloyl-ACP methyl ester carboxylesterase